MMPYHSYQTKTTKRKNRPKHFVIAGMVALGILGFFVNRGGGDQLVPTQNVQGESITVSSRYDMSSIALPQAGQSAVAIVEESMSIHASDDQIWPMASITKIITALTILEKAPMEAGEQGDILTLNQQDEDYYWNYAALLGTLTPVTAGYEMSQYEVLQTMLLASSNNMTDTLVDRYFDTREDFVQYTNDMLASFGLQHTRVADATGFSPQSVSTPTEMILVGKKALEHPVIAEIVAQPSASTRVAGWIPNYNSVIERTGVTGIKPGLTDESGYNLLFSSNTTNKDGEHVTVIGIVMGIFNRQEYTRSVHEILDASEVAISSQ